ncbi:hypothetical protein, partial [Brevundimonas aurifodinae]
MKLGQRNVRGDRWLTRIVACHPSSDLASLGHLLPQGEKDHRALFFSIIQRRPKLASKDNALSIRSP